LPTTASGRSSILVELKDGLAGHPGVLAPESIDEVIAETADRPLNGDEFLEALERLDVSTSQQLPR